MNHRAVNKFFSTDFAQVAWRYAAVKALILALALVGVLFPFGEGMREDNYVYQPPDPVSLRDRFSSFDGQWYLQIAVHGYAAQPIYYSQQNTNFFPLYSTLISVLTPWVGGAANAGLFVSYVAGFCAAYFLYRLVREDYPAAVAGDAVWYLLIFPTAVLLSAVYSESLFLGLAIGALYAGRRRRWLVAAMLGALAALTRSVGGLIVIPLLVQYMAAHRWRLRAWLSGAAIYAIIPVVVLAYLAYVGVLLGSQTTYLAAHYNGWQSHQQTLASLWHQLTGGKLFGYRDSALDLWLGSVFCILLVPLAMQLRPEYAVYAAAFTLTPIVLANNTMALSRYLLISWPHFLFLAQHRWLQHRWVRVVFSVLLLTGLMVYTWRFTNWRWIG
ncbi:MAG: mannosyltransferase family protein [Patescibacteria group bacterium]|nr:mannosyltransferase family protein [Patescibacteria group bacterium]